MNTLSEPIYVVLLVAPLKYSGRTNVLIGTMVSEIHSKSTTQENTVEAWTTAFIPMTSEIGKVTVDQGDSIETQRYENCNMSHEEVKIS